MKQYHEFCKHILKNGKLKNNRTDTQTLSVFGYQMRFDISKNFPLLTTKKVNFHSILIELLWFLKGDTNIKYLVDNKVNIWNEWPYENFKKSKDYKNESLKEFVAKIKADPIFAKKHGDLGPVYGKQWRNFNGVDQIEWLINNIKTKPFSRRHIISAWNPKEIGLMALAPCHTLIQFYVSNDKVLSCQLYQRSADVFLGVPFNIASYSLLTYIIAKLCNLKPGSFVHTFGDAHIYINHVDQVKLQLSRDFKPLPTLELKDKEYLKVEDFEVDDFILKDYKYHPYIKGKIAV